MRLVAIALSAAVIGFAGLAPAQAAPVSGSTLAVAPADGSFTKIQMRDRDFRRGYKKGYKKGHRHGFRPGSRHAHAPRGWHRHSYRPRDWRTRGCVVVGPVWFCP